MANESQQERPGHQFYSNVMRVHASPVDIALDFGDRAGNEEAQWDTRITMSWQHFKLMVTLLQSQLENYEGQLGPIPDLQPADSAEGSPD